MKSVTKNKKIANTALISGHLTIKNLLTGEITHLKNVVLAQYIVRIISNIKGGAAVTTIERVMLGTGTTAATDADTSLQTPVGAGVVYQSVASTNKSVTFTFLINNSSIADGDYTEIGLKTTDGLYATRALFAAPYHKAGGDLNVDYTLTFNT